MNPSLHIYRVLRIPAACLLLLALIVLGSKAHGAGMRPAPAVWKSGSAFQSYGQKIPASGPFGDGSLLHFRGRITDHQVTLDWETEMETQSSHYTVQCSLDGETFSDRGVVFTPDKKELASRSYHFSERQDPQASLYLFYRLKMVDLDQTARFSEIVSLRIPRTQHLTQLALLSSHQAGKPWHIRLGGAGARRPDGLLLARASNYRKPWSILSFVTAI